MNASQLKTGSKVQIVASHFESIKAVRGVVTSVTSSVITVRANGKDRSFNADGMEIIVGAYTSVYRWIEAA